MGSHRTLKRRFQRQASKARRLKKEMDWNMLPAWEKTRIINERNRLAQIAAVAMSEILTPGLRESMFASTPFYECLRSKNFKIYR